VWILRVESLQHYGCQQPDLSRVVPRLLRIRLSRPNPNPNPNPNRDSYAFNYEGSSPLVSGMYFDDWWPETGDFPDPFTNMKQDMGLTPAEQLKISKSYQANMKVIYDEMLKRGMFTWQQMWNGQSNPTAKNGCCTSPLVSEGATSCAASLRKYCAANSPSQTRVLNYAFSPGSCTPGGSGLVPLTAPKQDIANFLLIRGTHAYPNPNLNSNSNPNPNLNSNSNPNPNPNCSFEDPMPFWDTVGSDVRENIKFQKS